MDVHHVLEKGQLGADGQRLPTASSGDDEIGPFVDQSRFSLVLIQGASVDIVKERDRLIDIQIFLIPVCDFFRKVFPCGEGIMETCLSRDAFQFFLIFIQKGGLLPVVDVMRGIAFCFPGNPVQEILLGDEVGVVLAEILQGLVFSLSCCIELVDERGFCRERDDFIGFLLAHSFFWLLDDVLDAILGKGVIE